MEHYMNNKTGKQTNGLAIRLFYNTLTEGDPGPFPSCSCVKLMRWDEGLKLLLL